MDDFFNSPPCFKAYREYLLKLRRKFPFLRVFTIGKSVLGREIFALSIGKPSPSVIFAGAFHASEWLTTLLLLKFVKNICLAISAEEELCSLGLVERFNQRGLTVVPMVNPDGVEIAVNGPKSAGNMACIIEKIQSESDGIWQANARGVDLNHNFDAGFRELKELEKENGIICPSPGQYGGLYPHSEPESASLVRLVKSTVAERVYAFHSQGEEIFYEYGDCTPPQSKYIADLLCRASGYRIVQNSGLNSHGGFKDFFIEKYKRSGFTIEIGKGKNPLPITDLRRIYQKTEELMTIATVI